jgi:hypothetical protein
VEHAELQNLPSSFGDGSMTRKLSRDNARSVAATSDGVAPSAPSAFVSPRHHRDQLDDGAGSFWPTLWLTCTIAGGGIVVAVIIQFVLHPLWLATS